MVAYAAREIQLHDPLSYNEKVDIWAMGVVLYVLVFGQISFPRESLKPAIEHKNGEPIPGYRREGKAANNFGEESFCKVTDSLQSMLNKNIGDHLDAQQVLAHEWMDAKRAEVESTGGK